MKHIYLSVEPSAPTKSSNQSFTFRTYMILAFALIFMIVVWENNKGNTAIAASTIPQESIRLRILANSDDPMDQLVKRDIRDSVIAQIGEWAGGPQTLEQARETINSHLTEIEDLVGKELQKRGYSYGYKVELGQVPFPAKMYGGQVYPAGDYEALRISLGKAEGQNWWCVLFPPLCFVDVVSGDAVASTNEGKSAKGVQTKNMSSASDSKEKSIKAGKDVDKSVKTASLASDVKEKNDSSTTDTSNEKSGERQYRFFLWDWISSWFS
ncbi:stage II sporulation protein R [Paenibacillus sp. N1-5-1-14]|uniref:stage II sporulation protein R n=1 Tax=Paenibacillus radicibacter TaxID=2972488 RepID=UPI002158BED8|nr:stage II sporulation protein R [Paenibacillus radicibacter]MCR8645107.1 stage II sporulation protein R [Paenibacillus radicibacter]